MTQLRLFATIDKMEKCDVNKRLAKIGSSLRSILIDASTKNRVKIKLSGLDTLLTFTFETSNPDVTMTLFLKKCFEEDSLLQEEFTQI